MLKNTLIKLRDVFIRIKVYFSRTAGYISMINTAMILFLFLSNLEKYNIDISIQKWIIPMFVIGVLGMILFGYLEDKFGFFRQEQRRSQSRSPYLNDIVERLERIEKKLNK